MLRATLKGLLARKLRLLLSGAAVILGVMAVSGAIVVTDSLERSFDTLFQTVNQNLDVQVTGAPHVASGADGTDPVTQPIPAAVVDEVAAVPGVAKAIGAVIVDGARVVGPDGKILGGPGPPSFGVGWRGEVGFVELRHGRDPQAAEEVAISAGLAKQGGFTIGHRIEVLTLQPKKTFTVVGIFGYTGGRDSLGGETRVAFTEPVAQELMLGQRGVFSAVNVLGDDQADPVQLRDAIHAQLGDRYLVRTRQQVAEDQAEDVTGFLGVIRNVLLGFAAVALFVGIFLILNTFSILVAQRTRELALFRALGASRPQLVGSVLLEAVVIGLLSATLGLGAGIGIATLLRMVMEAFSGAQLPSAGLTVPLAAVAAAYLVGVLVTVVAALVPALRASRIPPVAAMRDTEARERPLTRLTLGGTVPTASGAGAIGAALFGDTGATVPLLLGGVLVTFVGVAMMTPLITAPCAGFLGHALSWSVPGNLGRRNAIRNPRRTAITAVTLTIGIALVAGVSVLASSLKASLEDLVRHSLAAELVISGENLEQRGQAVFDPAVIDEVRAIEGVRTAVAVHTDIAQLGGETIEVSAGDLPPMIDILALRAVTGELRSLGAAEIVVDEDFAKSHDATPGTTLRIATQRGGPQAFTVVGVFKQSRVLPGPVVMSPAAAATFRTPGASFGYIALHPGADTAGVEQTVRGLLAANPEIGVRSQDDFVQQLTSQVDSTAVLLYILLGLSIIIATLGIVNTLALSIVERTRELGLTRAIGMPRAQVAAMITAESVVISLFGALLGTALGVALGAAVARALSDDFVPILAIPWSQIAVFLALAVSIGLVAAVVPAIRAARTDVLRAIAYE
jgi:putative ABC transport system permease protein